MSTPGNSARLICRPYASKTRPQTLAKDYNKFPFYLLSAHQQSNGGAWNTSLPLKRSQDEKMMSLLYPSRIVTEDNEERFGDDGSRCCRISSVARFFSYRRYKKECRMKRTRTRTRKRKCLRFRRYQERP
jgi:hypothetical protein